MQHELICKNERCAAYQPVASMTADEDLHCECGARLEIAVYPVASVWVGDITSKYLDKSKEGGYAKDGSHWFFERDKVTGKTTPVLVTNWAQQKEICKRNGVARPSEMGNNYEVSSDGTEVKNSVGLPGCEV